MKKNIESLLAELTQVTSQQKSASDIDPATSHPIGKVDDGTIPAKEGEFAAENKSQSKEMGTPAGVDSTTSPVNPEKKPADKPNEIPSTTADQPAPADVKPEVTTTESETNKAKKEASVLDEIADFMKKASAIQPVKTEPKTTEPAPAKVASVDDATAQLEKAASEQIQEMLKISGIDLAKATPAEKKAALIKVATAKAERSVDGFLVTLDKATFEKALRGEIVKKAADEIMPPEVPADGGAMDPQAAAPAPAGAPAPAPAPEAGAPAGQGSEQEAQVMQLLQQAEQGQITPDQLMQALQALGIDPQLIQAVMSQMGQAGGAPAAAPAEAPAPTPAPEAAPAEAGKEGSDGPAEEKKEASANDVTTMRKALASLLVSSI